MRKIAYSMIALAVLGGPATLQGQNAGGGQRGERPEAAARRAMGDPAARMLAQREALGLSAAQVARLEAIGVRLRERNSPLTEQVRENHTQAMQEANAVLTAEQQTRLTELRAARLAEARVRTGRDGRDRMRQTPGDRGPRGRRAPGQRGR